MQFDLESSTQVLARTPATLATLLRELPESWTGSRTEGPDTWSVFDVVGHLVHGEITDWIPRARIILEHGVDRPFDKFDRFAQFKASQGKSLGDLLDAFARLRAGNLETLAGFRLSDADLERKGRHPELGIVTLSQLLATWVAHDLDHVVQISRVMAKGYTEAVGPWTEYLRVVR